MKDLDECYIQLLHFGFIVMRQAQSESDLDWLESEIDFLHNVPDLIGEQGSERHDYFWNAERDIYIGKTKRSGNELRLSRMKTYYEPVFNEMERIRSESAGES